MEYLVNRVFSKRETEKSNWSGRIGSVEMKADVASIIINDFELPKASIEYLLNFSLQSLQDAYAGAEDLTEATANWQKKFVALCDGTIGVRSGGGMSDEERAELYVAEQALRSKLSKEEWKAMSDEAKVSRVESAVEKLKAAKPEAFAEKVAERVAYIIEQRKRRAAEKAVDAGDIEL